ncbi:MAG: TetR/AcrR family transcriptional regulator [Desulfomonile tiedjei]|uniref:TetR/AcrR family transcriptional regulator n=1 Tax=Desulfomonile tiedjei TaxID=2358 RepID=A0A9D6V132_9BACT|nr:TetR/AcrR family transcriptional regulator [Desulfomonile tiedjei]
MINRPEREGPARERKKPVRTSKEEIQEKAMDLFMKSGYHGMSTRDLCKALGISRPTLYWYFKDKEDILFSLHKNRLERGIRPLLARMKEIDDPLTRIRLFIHQHTRTVCSSPDTKVLINETEYLAPEHAQWVRGLWGELLDELRQTLRELKEDGTIKEVDELFAAFSLIGIVMWPYTWFDHTRPEGIEGLIDTIEEMFFTGLLKPSISWRARGLSNPA